MNRKPKKQRQKPVTAFEVFPFRKLKGARAELELSLEDVAEKSGVSVQTAVNVLNGKPTTQSDSVAKVALVLGYRLSLEPIEQAIQSHA